ncbi:MAG: hypothetical protein AAF988_02445 [Pseudomonadota bacterium]
MSLKTPYNEARFGKELHFPNYEIDLVLLRSINLFLEICSDLTIEDSRTEEGVRHIVGAFTTLLEENRCFNSLNNLPVLLEEKGEQDAWRADGITPNLLHEIRNVAHGLSFISTRCLPMRQYLKHGGLDADISARLRHDSIEDKGKRKSSDIYAGMERALEELSQEGLLDEAEHYCKRMEATIAVELIDRMTRKDAAIDPSNGRIIFDEEKGKVKKVVRFDGDEQAYFDRLLTMPLAILIKYSDRIENVGTRLGVDRFSIEKNREYAEKTRFIYGVQQFINRALEKWPEFKYAIQASDDMLGIQLRILEACNRYLSDPDLRPDRSFPVTFDEYAPNGLYPYSNLPEIFHPLSVALESIERHAKKSSRMNIVGARIAGQLNELTDGYGFNPIPGINKRFWTNSSQPQSGFSY